MSKLLVRVAVVAAVPFLLFALGWELAVIYVEELRRR